MLKSRGASQQTGEKDPLSPKPNRKTRNNIDINSMRRRSALMSMSGERKNELHLSMQSYESDNQRTGSRNNSK